LRTRIRVTSSLTALVTAVLDASFELRVLREYPFSNGDRVYASLIEAPGRRGIFPDGAIAMPLTFGLVAKKVTRAGI